MSNPQFDVFRFEDLISDPATGGRGRPFRWESGRKCPCYVERLRSPKEDCPLCEGLGRVYTLKENPEGGPFFGAILSIMGDRKYAKFGEWLAGDSVLTFANALKIGDRDRITLLDGEYSESELLIRGTRDKLADVGAFEVTECGDEERTYQVGLDFNLVDGEIAWVGQQPAEGVTYSVRYLARYAYVVWLQIPQDRTHVPTVASDGSLADEVMPRKVALRRWVDFVRAPNAS